MPNALLELELRREYLEKTIATLESEHKDILAAIDRLTDKIEPKDLYNDEPGKEV